MALNVCVNGLFRYDKYIQYYEKADLLSRFYYSHRVGTNATKLGIPVCKTKNIFWKEYGLHATLRLLKPHDISSVMTLWGDVFQSGVLASWSDCSGVEVVIGELSDRILSFAKRNGVRTISHPVTSHPATFFNLVADEQERLGLPVSNRSVSERRLAEIEMSDVIIADSAFVAKSFINAGVEAKRIHVILPGNDSRLFHPRRPDDRNRDVFRVVSVGAVSARKGHRYLLEAWKKLALPGSELIIVGANTSDTQRIVHGYEDIFHHIPKIPNSELRDLLITASVFVLPSIEDGFAQAAIEALSCGVPVIVTQNAGVADLVVQGENGFVVPAGAPDAIAAALLGLYEQPELADAMGLNAAMGAGQSASWRRYVSELAPLLRQPPAP